MKPFEQRSSSAAYSSCLAVIACIGALAATPVFAATPVGVRVLAQEWDPRKPEAQTVRTLVDEPDIVSRALAEGWRNARDPICARLKAELGKPGIAKGQSLYNIDCRLAKDANFTVESASANVLHARLALPGSSVTATSTVPDPLPRSLDPRFSLTLDATLTVTLQVQPDPNNTLRATQIRLALAGARIDSHNASGDAIKFVVDDLIPFFGGPNFLRMAEKAVNDVSQDVAPKFNTAMAPVNGRLRGPSELVRIGVWGRPSRITVAFAPREVTPPGGGTVTGAVRWDPAQYRPKDCASFQLPATVQTGPAPLLNPDNHAVVGVAPTRKVGTATLTPAGDRECSFTITGLPQGWPAHIEPQVDGVSRVQTGGNTFFKRVVALVPDGWSGAVVASIAQRDYKIAEQTRPSNVAQQRQKVTDPLGPVARERVQDQVVQPAVRSAPEAVNAQGAAVANPVATAPNAARSTSTATSVPAVTAPTPATRTTAVSSPVANTTTDGAATTNAWKGGTPTTSTATSSTAPRVQAPTTGVTTRPDASATTAVTRLPSTTQRTTTMPDSAFAR